jgi:hypothetical protein
MQRPAGDVGLHGRQDAILLSFEDSFKCRYRFKLEPIQNDKIRENLALSQPWLVKTTEVERRHVHMRLNMVLGFFLCLPWYSVTKMIKQSDGIGT